MWTSKRRPEGPHFLATWNLRSMFFVSTFGFSNSHANSWSTEIQLIMTAVALLPWLGGIDWCNHFSLLLVDTWSIVMMRLKEIFDALKPYPDLYHNLHFDVAEHFVQFAGHVKRKIQLSHSSRASGPPLTLPIYILDFLRDLLALNSLETAQCWSALKHIVWSRDPEGRESELSKEEVELFERIGSRPHRVEEKIGV